MKTDIIPELIGVLGMIEKGPEMNSSQVYDNNNYNSSSYFFATLLEAKNSLRLLSFFSFSLFFSLSGKLAHKHRKQVFLS